MNEKNDMPCLMKATNDKQPRQSINLYDHYQNDSIDPSFITLDY